MAWAAASCRSEEKLPMPTKIRLARHGAKKRPFYRVVVANSESPRDGRFLETVGTYNPLSNPALVTLKNERIREWLDRGAIPTDTVRSLLKKEGVLSSLS